MKTKYYIPSIMIITIIISCSGKRNNQTNVSSLKSIKDTVYVKTDSTIILESLYLNLDSIKIGEPFTNKDEKFSYYRLLFSSSEETQSVYVEKIDIIDDGQVELGKRFRLSPELFGNDFKAFPIAFVNWEAPEIVKIIINGTLINLNLTSLKFEKVVP